MLPLKIRMWAVVDDYGDILSIKHFFPEDVNRKEYVIPVTLTMGHTWLEGFGAYLAAVRANL